MTSPDQPTPIQPAPQVRKPSRKWFILGGILLALVLLALLAYPSLKLRWTAPLGPSLDLPTYTPTNVQAATAPTKTAALAGPEDIQETATQAIALSPVPGLPSPSSTPSPLCGGPPAMLILGIGVDTDDDTYSYGLGDAVRVARVDFTIPSISLLSLPRDVWVEIPGISDHYGITHGKLNQSFLYGSPGMGYYDGPGAGPGLMARTLDQNFGLRVDHYGAVNMITFARIIDAVGGIDVYLPTDVDGSPLGGQGEDMGYFYAGDNHFSGEAAMRFIRVRKHYNDFTRQDNQNMVLCALSRKLRSPEIIPKIPQIINAFKDSVITDLSLEQLSQLACLLPYLKVENLTIANLPQELFTPTQIYSLQMRNNTFALQADFQAIRDYIQQFIAGTWPTASQAGQPSCP